MHNASVEQRVEQMQAELSAFRKIIEEQNQVIKTYMHQQESMKSNLQEYVSQVDQLKKENKSLKQYIESVNNSQLSLPNHPDRSHNSFSMNEGDDRFRIRTTRTSNLHNTSMPLIDENNEFSQRPLTLRTQAKINSPVSEVNKYHNTAVKNKDATNKLRLSDRMNLNKFKLKFNEKEAGPQIPLLMDRLKDKRAGTIHEENIPSLKAITPDGLKKFFNSHNSNHTLESRDHKRSESFSGRIAPSPMAFKELEYEQYLDKVTEETKAEKIKQLINLCDPLEKTPKSYSDNTQSNRLKSKQQVSSSGNTPEAKVHIKSQKAKLNGVKVLFHEDVGSIKSNSLSHQQEARTESNHIEKQSNEISNSELKAVLQSINKNDDPAQLGQKRSLSKKMSFSYHSRSDEDSSKSKIETYDLKKTPPLKSMVFDSFDLHKLYEDFLIVGCQKDKLGSYITQGEIAFSVLFDLYALDPKDPNNQNDELVKFMIPFSQKIRTVKVKNNMSKINEVIFQDEASCKSFEFFSISLNSNIASDGSNETYKPTERFFRKGDLGLLKETNPNLCYYYYCAKIEDFFIDTHHSKNSSSDTIEFSFFPKYFVIKTLYPFSQLFYTVLQQIISLSKRRRIERFVETMKEGKLAAHSLESIDGQGMFDLELAAVIPLLEKLDEISMDNNFEEKISIEITNVSIHYTFPSVKNCSFVEAEFGFARILSQFSFEEFLFIFFSILLEQTVVFVSENMSNISACISLFVSLLRPFKWPFPIIYSLPEDCLVMLGSPIPLLVGINLPAETVIHDILPEHDKKTRADANSNIYVFIDHGLFFYDFESMDSVLIPQYDEFVEKLEKIYKKSFCQRPSPHFKILKKKQNKSVYNYIKKQNTAKMKERLVKVDRSQIAKTLDKSQLDKFKHNSLTKNPEDFNIFHFFRFFFNSFVISKLPHDRTISQFGKETKIKEIDINFFSSNPSDVEFLEQFMKTQSFMYYIENDFYGISNPTHDK
jgi:hypothetical protein